MNTLITKENINELLFKLNLVQKVDCIGEEQNKFLKFDSDGVKLPNGIYKDGVGANAIYYRIKKSELNDDEMKFYLSLKEVDQAEQLKSLLNTMINSNNEINSSLKTIKNLMLFFAIIFLLGIIISMIVSCGIMA